MMQSFFNKFNLVRQIPVFQKLNWFDQQKIARKAVVIEYKKGDRICEQGHPPDFLYCLVSGRLQAYSLRDGQKENVEFIHRGMHFGIISLLTGESHSLTFEALNDSVVIQIPKEDFTQLINSISQLGVEVSQSLSKRVRTHRQGVKSIFESTIITVYSPVQGTGSSTYAINLAMSLEKETRKKVIYLNIQTGQQEAQKTSEKKSSSPQWKTPPIPLSEIVGDHEKIIASVIQRDVNVDLLNVFLDADEPSSKKQIAPFVSALVGDYHYVVVDLPNEMDDIVEETLTQSDIVHLISSDQKKDLETTRKVIDHLEVNLKERFRHEHIKVVIKAKQDKIYLSFEDINAYIDFDIYGALPHIRDDDLTVNIETECLSFLCCHDRAEYAMAIRRIAREIGGVLVGLVLGGGAALGVAHIGVIRVLEEANIPVDLVVGSSMGALVGSMWTTGKDSRELEKVAREFESGVQMLKLFDPPLIPISGLVRGRAITKWLRKHLGNRTFYSVKIPFKAITYDLVRRQEFVIESGSLVDAVRESVSIPGVIPPIRKKEHVLIDGGVLNPLPVNVCAARGIKKIIAVNVLQSPEHVSAGFDMELLRDKEAAGISFLQSPLKFVGYRVKKMLAKPFNPNISDIIVQTLQATEYVIAEQTSQQADILIHPDLTGIRWFELYKVDELIKRGEDATRDLLPEIKKLIED